MDLIHPRHRQQIREAAEAVTFMKLKKMAAGYKPTLVKVNAHDNDKQEVKRVTTYYRCVESSFREEEEKKK